MSEMRSEDASPDTNGRSVAIAGAMAVVLAIAVTLVWQRMPTGVDPLPAPGLSAVVDAQGLNDQSYAVTLAVLHAVYGAFAQTDEAAIYDGLATVAAGEALEDLYLERAGALASGGVPDQLVRELELTGGTWSMEDGQMTADIRWAVLGQVGHGEHTHIRGNAYSAELVISPANDAWRLTDFRLKDVDRTGAGAMVVQPNNTATTINAERE